MKTGAGQEKQPGVSRRVGVNSTPQLKTAPASVGALKPGPRAAHLIPQKEVAP